MSAPPTSIREHINRIYRTRTLRGEDGLEYRLLPGAVSEIRGEFLYQHFLVAKAVRTLETGLGSGLSSLFILDATTKNGAGPHSHIVMDPKQDSSFHHGVGTRLLKDAGVWDLVDFYPSPSQIVMPRLISEGSQVDAVFIDGDHRFDGAFCDVYFAHRLLRPGGVMVIDDIWMDAVFLVAHFLETSYRYETIAELREGYSSAGPDAEVDESFTYGRAKNRPAIRAYRKPVKDVGEDYSFSVPFQVARDAMPEDVARRRGSELSREALLEMSKGNSRAARALLMRALRFEPTRTKTYLRLARTFLPAKVARALGGSSSRGERLN